LKEMNNKNMSMVRFMFFYLKGIVYQYYLS
jgi:hypothetical protein